MSRRFLSRSFEVSRTPARMRLRPALEYRSNRRDQSSTKRFVKTNPFSTRRNLPCSATKRTQRPPACREIPSSENEPNRQPGRPNVAELVSRNRFTKLIPAMVYVVHCPPVGFRSFRKRAAFDRRKRLKAPQTDRLAPSSDRPDMAGRPARRCHRSAEARRFDFLSDAHARLTQAFRDGDAEMARAMLEQGVPPPRQANISETLNAHPELVEPLLFAVSPSGFQSQCLTPPPFTLPFGPSPWPLACLWAFAKGTERVRQAFLEHPCLQRNPHVSRALLSGVLQSDFLTGAKACALAKEVWGHFTPSQREALLQRTGHANPRISRFSANILGAALWRLASFSRCCDANERVEFLLSLLQPSRQEIQSLLEGTAEGISQECLRLLVDHGANATQALWSFIRAPQCGGPYQEANTLARFGARVSHAELEAFFKSPAGAVQSQWSRARLCKKLQSYGALIPDLPPAPAPRRRRFWELPKPRGH